MSTVVNLSNTLVADLSDLNADLTRYLQLADGQNIDNPQERERLFQVFKKTFRQVGNIHQLTA